MPNLCRVAGPNRLGPATGVIRLMISRFPRIVALALLLVALPATAAPTTQQRLALTRYFYGYQADTRKPLPSGQPTLGPKGQSLLAVRPMMGTGPWFGYGHSMWHRENLSGMRHSGMDVALPVFRADSASLSGYALAGLDSMTQALVELKREHQDYPLIGMFYDTTSLSDAGKPFDVSTDAGKQTFYNGIRLFFRHVPEEFRAMVQTPDGQADILALDTVSPLTGVDAGLRNYCDEHFRADFGRRLLWMAESDWKALVPSIEAFASFNEGRGLKIDTDGPISVATVGPGYNDTGLGHPNPFILPRSAGTTMIDDWRSLFKSSADWILIESWNDFDHGSAVTASRDYGVRDQDETMAGLLQFRGDTGLLTQALRVNAPEVMPPRAVVPIEVVVQNGSLEQWGRGNISFAASWYQDGKLVEEGPRIPVLQKVPVMGLLTVPVAAVTARKDGTPLPDGKYLVRLEFYRSSFDPSQPAYTPFKAPAAEIPVSIGTPLAPEARLVTSDVSPYLMAGTASTCKIVLRNDGPAAWPKGSTTIAWRIVKDGSDAPVASGESAAFGTDVPPGGLSEVTTLTLLTPQTAADQSAGYTLMWDVVSSGTRLPVFEAPGTPARRSITVLPLLELAHFPLGNSVPASWDAGTDQDIRTLVQNNGPTTWKASTVKIGYHWYYWDGTEALWDGQKTALPEDLKPGEQVVVHATATAPLYAGPYVFSLDIWDGKQWISTLPGTAGFDMSLAYVNVVGGNLRPVDLTGLFDLDGIASEASPGDGEFADGMCYPGEQVPPNVQPPLQMSSAPRGPYPPGVAPVLYPAGYFGPVDTVGTQSIRRIPFRYPTKKDGDRNFVFARGQSLPVGQGTYNKLYILGAATQDTEGVFTLRYADGTSTEIPLKLSGWSDGPQHGEAVGLECTYRRSAKGDDPAKHAYLYIYELPADPIKTLTSITFPEGRRFRICAITADHKSTFSMPKPIK